MDKTPEQKVAETILQRPEKVTIGSETYEVAPPSIATLILVSEAVAQFPQVTLDREVVTESLYVAKDCRILGDALAILILGAKGLKRIKDTTKKRFFGLLKDRRQFVEDSKAILSEKILKELTPEQTYVMLFDLLAKMETAFFLTTITFLIGVNLTKETKEPEETKTTASGL
jgi:hypothetical protein